jgi:hypothetical protein
MKSLVFSLFGASLILMFFCAAQAEDQSLVLFLPLDEGRGQKVKDLSLHKNDGTLQGKEPEWVDGRRGKALNFAGGIIMVPHDDSLNLDGAHTISFWLKWNGLGAGWSPIIAKRPVGAVDPDNYSTWVGTDRIWDYRTDNSKVSAKTPIAFDNKTWVFLALTHDGKRTVTFYIDGIKDVAVRAEPGFANKGPFVVGSGKGGEGDMGFGNLDEMALFNRALEQDEIYTLMDKGAEPFLAVEPAGKFTITWGRIKNNFKHLP